MLNKEAIVEKATSLGFEDVGFTTAHPFNEQRRFLEQHQTEYGWAERAGLNLLQGTDPRTVLPGAQTIIVLLEVYFKKAFPRSMEAHFGRCYLDDDRVTKGGLSRRIKAFRGFLRDHGIDSRVPANLPHRMAAARAGMGTFGKNCLFYSNRVARRSSWNLPVAVVIDREFPPGDPTFETDCPDWCRNTCISACPTRALLGNARIDPGKCISYLSYFGEGITPLALREPMGMYVYGCDRCQNVCPRNQAWFAKELPPNEKVLKKVNDFNLSALLHMDKAYFEVKIWPHMFYMSYGDVWRWKMNVARVMGNTGDKQYIPDLVRAFSENTDDRVRGMALWALGRTGGKNALKAIMNENRTLSDVVASELKLAFEMNSG